MSAAVLPWGGVAPEDLDAAQAETLGRTLRPIRRKLLKRRDDGRETAWFRGGEPYFEVVLELEPGGELVWFQLSLRGRVLTWEAPDRLNTGSTGELALHADALPATRLVSGDRRPNPALLAVARRCLEARGRRYRLLRTAASKLAEADARIAARGA